MFDSPNAHSRGIALFSTRILALGALVAPIALTTGCQVHGTTQQVGASLVVAAPMDREASLQEMMDAAPAESAPQRAGAKASEANEADAVSAKEKLDEAIEAKVTAEEEREYKVAELELAKLERDVSEIKIAEGLRAKREALAVALEARDRFESVERVIETRKADLSLERSRDRLLKAATDLENMREIMSEEAEAKNKEEIIRRYEKGFEFAQESVGIEEAERAHMVDDVLPAKLAKLTGAVRAAEAALQAEEISARKATQKAELDLLKATNAAAAAKRKVKKAVAKVGRLRGGKASKKGGGNKNKSKKSGKATVSKKSDGAKKTDKSDK